MAENWTQFTMEDIPRDVRRTLRDRALRQTVEKYQAPAEMFAEAERLVAAGYVQLTMRNVGMVWDATTTRLGGGWLAVSTSYCAHCDDARQPAVCRHKLAIWFADLLARHLPDDDETSAAPAATGAGPGHGTPGGIGRAGGGGLGPTRHARAARGGNGKNCPYCGGFLTAAGACNKAVCPTNRGGRV